MSMALKILGSFVAFSLVACGGGESNAASVSSNAPTATTGTTGKTGITVVKPNVSPWQGDPALGKIELNQQWLMIQTPIENLPIRGTVRFALEAAALGYQPERIDAALALVRELQDRDPASDTFGNFRWKKNELGVSDPNAVEFAMAQLSLIRLKFVSALTPQGRALLDDIMNDGIIGLRKHTVKPNYTNIYLTKTWNLIAAGESLSRSDVADEGYAQLRSWLEFTAVNGITEYDASTYYGIDLEALGLIVNNAARVEGRAQATLALQYFWTNLAANWWIAGDRIGGVNGRSYDYLYGGGYTDLQTYSAGWLRAKPDLEGAGWLPSAPRSNLSAVYQAGEWIPPVALTESVRQEVPRVIRQAWGVKLGQRAVQYVGKSFSIASSGYSSGADDRTLIANLGDSPQIPQLLVFMDGRGDPYGQNKTADSRDKLKSLHLTPFIAAVQRGSDVLQVLSNDPASNPTDVRNNQLSSFFTQLILPSIAELWSGENPVSPGSTSAPVVIDNVKPLFIRLGDAVIAIRFLLATNTDNERATIEFVEDKKGFAARRITIVHSQTTPKARATTVVWMRGEEGMRDNAAFAAFRQRFSQSQAQASIEGAILNASVTSPKDSHVLKIKADIVKGTRLILEGDEPDALLSVNGRDIGNDLLKGYKK
jgi:hypothetical protein